MYKNSTPGTRLTLSMILLAAAVPVFGQEAAPKPKPQPRVLVAPEALAFCQGEGRATARRAYLGVEATPISPELRRHFGSPENRGVLVSRVIEGGPAARAGLAVGDVVTRCAGAEVEEPRDLRTAVRDRKGGESVEVEVFRAGKARTLKVQLEEKETCAFDLASVVDLSTLEELRGLGRLEELKALEHLDIDIAGIDIEGLVNGALGLAAAGVDEALRNRDWEKEVERVNQIRSEELEKRMEEVARHLAQLEARLSDEAGRYGDKARAEIDRAREELRRELEKSRQEIEKEVRKNLENARREAEAARRELDKARAEADKARAKGGGGEIL